jgi:8-oxo-dGTP pyrophosphatase MutT (NUDIX family)
MHDEVIVLVDADNRIIGEVARSQVQFGIDYHRATYILVFDTDGRLLIQKRTMNKAFCPGYYGVTTGGVVATGETYLASAHRELFEELGFDAELTCHGVFYTEGESFRIWGKIYTCCYDPHQHGELDLQPNEVASVHYMSLDEVLANPHQLRFTPDSLDALVHYVEKRVRQSPNDPL